MRKRPFNLKLKIKTSQLLKVIPLSLASITLFCTGANFSVIAKLHDEQNNCQLAGFNSVPLIQARQKLQEQRYQQKINYKLYVSNIPWQICYVLGNPQYWESDNFRYKYEDGQNTSGSQESIIDQGEIRPVDEIVADKENAGGSAKTTETPTSLIKPPEQKKNHQPPTQPRQGPKPIEAEVPEKEFIARQSPPGKAENQDLAVLSAEAAQIGRKPLLPRSALIPVHMPVKNDFSIPILRAPN